MPVMMMFCRFIALTSVSLYLKWQRKQGNPGKIKPEMLNDDRFIH